MRIPNDFIQITMSFIREIVDKDLIIHELKREIFELKVKIESKQYELSKLTKLNH
jgi:hypothetical protein